MSTFVMFCVAFVWAIDISLRPYLLKIILNRVSIGAPQDVFSFLALPVIAYLAVTLMVVTIFRLYGYFIEIKMIPSMRKSISCIAIGSMMDKSYNYYQNNYSGSLSNKINDLVSSVPDLVQISIDRFFSHSLALLFAIITLWQVSALFSAVMLIWSSLFIIGSLYFAKHMTGLAENWSELGSKVVGKSADIISNILSVRLFAAKNRELTSYGSICDKTVKAERKLQWAYFWFWSFHGYSIFILLIINFYLLLKGRQEGWITVGDFALVLVLNISIVDFMAQLGKDFSQYSKLFGRITQALNAVLNTAETKDVPGATKLIVNNGSICFDNVHFKYSNAEPLFENKSIVIEPGQKVGLVGYSGGGKTTFVNLILRLHDVDAGTISIDNQNIYAVTQDSLHKAIGMIPQDPSLFHRSLMENIHYGRLDATDEEVIKAAKQAHAHEFIAKLPQGYKSLVGERGVKLSGGQRQRIAIARAFLKNAPILILDEATSQLDSVTEKIIQDSLWNLMQEKTTIVIAHRLSTLLHMDRILVFENGKIVEDGSHRALLAKHGLYKTLWDAQVGGFLPDMDN